MHIAIKQEPYHCAEHHHFALREVHHVGRAKDDHESERGQGINAAERKAVERDLSDHLLSLNISHSPLSLTLSNETWSVPSCLVDV